jgi:hypothetical protein
MNIPQKRLLDKGKIERLVSALRSLRDTNAEVVEKIRSEAEYFEKSAERMRYRKLHRQHLFVGSGVIEAGCKTVIGARLRRSGMFWSAGPMQSWGFVAAISTDGSRIIGRLAWPPDLNFYVAHPRGSQGRSNSGLLA